MLNQIQTLLENIGRFFTDIGEIIKIIWKGMTDIPNLLHNAITQTSNILIWAFPSVIASTLIIILAVVVIYKIFGRT